MPRCMVDWAVIVGERVCHIPVVGPVCEAHFIEWYEETIKRWESVSDTYYDLLAKRKETRRDISREIKAGPEGRGGEEPDSGV